MFKAATRISNRLIKIGEKHSKTDLRYFLKGGFWVGGGNAVTTILNLILAIGFANLLSKTDYGTYKYILSILSFLSIAALPGINTSIARSVARGFEGSMFSGMRFSMRWGLAGTGASLLLAGYYFWKDNADYAFALAAVAAGIPFISSLNVYGAYLNGRQLYKRFALYQNFKQGGIVVSLIIGTLIFRNPTVLVCIYVIATITMQAVLLKRTVAIYPPNGRTEPGGKMYGFHLSVHKSLDIAATTIQSIFLAQISGVAVLATYAIAAAPVEQIRSLNSAIPTLVIPKVSDPTWKVPTISSFLRKMLFPTVALSAVVIAYIVAAPYFFTLLFPNYLDAVFYSQVLALGALPTFFTKVMDSILQACKSTKVLYALNISNNILLIVLSLAFTYWLGLWGLVLAIVIRKCVMTFEYLIALHNLGARRKQIIS